ncbi:MAG: hypothetical protein ACJAUV_001170 [Flavobacteriales bacterium]|jgi:hypothetical protein
MKLIRIPSRIHFLRDSTDGTNIKIEADLFDENKLQVLNAFTTIEVYISHLITYEFLGKYDKNREAEFEKFMSKIINTSWFNFNEKQKMIVDILCLKVETKKEKEAIKQLFITIMNIRNAIAHGKFLTDGKKSVLEYYQSQFISQELNVVYWDKVESNMIKAYQLLNQHLKEKGIIK